MPNSNFLLTNNSKLLVGRLKWGSLVQKCDDRGFTVLFGSAQL